MGLEEEISRARKKVVTDGYEMSFGELINLYKNEELVIDPAFQRLFRWDDERKTRFVESLILGIPIPPIFVSMDDDGIWELIDGLQRVSTVLQLTGDLRGEKAEELGQLVLNGTRFLPSLHGKVWGDGDGPDQLGRKLQLEIRRARVRIEILKSESDLTAKFELFQRLNTGGQGLTPQEVRNSVCVSLNKELYDWLVARVQNENFKNTTNLTEKAVVSATDMELALRFLAFRHVEYTSGLDVHEYLDEALIQIAINQKLDLDTEREIFDATFEYLNEALSDAAFKRWDGQKFSGKFLMSVFEVLATSVALNITQLAAMDKKARTDLITTKAQDLWSNEIFQSNSGAGIRGTTRLARLIPLARVIF